MWQIWTTSGRIWWKQSLFSQNWFSVNFAWLGALVLTEGWAGMQQRKVITVFMMRMLFLTPDSILSRKLYWRNFSLVSISGRLGPLQAIGFTSLMNTMNHVGLLPWASEKPIVRCIPFLVKEAGFIPPQTHLTDFDFCHLLILFSLVNMNRYFASIFQLTDFLNS